MSSSAAAAAAASSTRDAAKLAMCAFGICACYLCYGILQEKFFSERILGATFLLVWSCLANTLVATGWQKVSNVLEKRNRRNQVVVVDDNGVQRRGLNHPLLLLTSFCYVSAMTSSNASLAFVSYPTAVLAKSCKLIPTMAMGLLVERKTYSLLEWMAAGSITLGIVIFNLSRMKSKAASAGGKQQDSPWGVILLALSLCMDGFLGSCQGLLKRTDTRTTTTTTTSNKKKNDDVVVVAEEIELAGDDLKQLRLQRPPTAVETMYWINLYALLYLVPLAVLTGEWSDGLARMNPVLLGMTLLTLSAAMGQIFIFLTITWYSPLVCTTITTTRKFFTILLSVLNFGHQFTTAQWTSVGLVFSGLYLGIVSKQTKRQQQPAPVSPHENKMD